MKSDIPAETTWSYRQPDWSSSFIFIVIFSLALCRWWFIWKTRFLLRFSLMRDGRLIDLDEGPLEENADQDVLRAHRCLFSSMTRCEIGLWHNYDAGMTIDVAYMTHSMTLQWLWRMTLHLPHHDMKMTCGVMTSSAMTTSMTRFSRVSMTADDCLWRWIPKTHKNTVAKMLDFKNVP